MAETPNLTQADLNAIKTASQPTVGHGIVLGSNGKLPQGVANIDTRSSPPSSPKDGEIWYFSSGSSGEVWTFRYNLGSSSSYKWEFVGGSEVLILDTSGTARRNTNTTTWEVMPGQSTLTTIRAGQYVYEFGAVLEITTANTAVLISPGVGGAQLFGVARLQDVTNTTSGLYTTVSYKFSDVVLSSSRAASDVVSLFMWTGGVVGDVAAYYPWISIKPIRVI